MRRGPETQEESLEYPYKAQHAAAVYLEYCCRSVIFLVKAAVGQIEMSQDNNRRQYAFRASVAENNVSANKMLNNPSWR